MRNATIVWTWMRPVAVAMGADDLVRAGDDLAMDDREWLECPDEVRHKLEAVQALIIQRSRSVEPARVEAVKAAAGPFREFFDAYVRRHDEKTKEVLSSPLGAEALAFFVSVKQHADPVAFGELLAKAPTFQNAVDPELRDAHSANDERAARVLASAIRRVVENVYQGQVWIVWNAMDLALGVCDPPTTKIGSLLKKCRDRWTSSTVVVPLNGFVYWKAIRVRNALAHPRPLQALRFEAGKLMLEDDQGPLPLTVDELREICDQLVQRCNAMRCAMLATVV